MVKLGKGLLGLTGTMHKDGRDMEREGEGEFAKSSVVILGSLNGM